MTTCNYRRQLGKWCDLVILSAILVQKLDFHALIRKAVQLGKKVAVGAYPTFVPQDALNSGADYLILDEGITIPHSSNSGITGYRYEMHLNSEPCWGTATQWCSELSHKAVSHRLRSL